ncbi:E3 ubiquitin-protein ligase rad18 [Ceratocystis pirilliformis]|uniref:Postreplication repair E3 ubiquitin-protein ligase RAD18 n=1 Tax=Ceratocystis pirilliformis TaxID=259994 RepID=A0ABR3ZFQ2_9PEZI
MADTGVPDIPDATDWLTTFVPEMGPVEAAMRCEICKDFYKTPMITSCNHTFCSLCIRRVLRDTSKCPLCSSLDQEMKLRKCPVFEDTIEAFISARSALIKFCQTKNAQDEQQGQQRVAEGPPSSLDLPSPSSKRTHLEATTANPTTESTRRSKRIRSSVKSTVSYRLDSEAIKDDIIEVHSSNSQDPDFEVGPETKPPERLPVLSYSLLKDAHLRRKLTELGLPSHGSRALQISRHQEWTTLWNANCDSRKPKRKQELLRDLDQWERLIANPRQNRLPVHSSGRINIKDKDFDATSWASKHKESFKELVIDAQRSRAQAKNAQESTEPSSLLSLPNPALANSAQPSILSRSPSVEIIDTQASINRSPSAVTRDPSQDSTQDTILSPLQSRTNRMTKSLESSPNRTLGL